MLESKWGLSMNLKVTKILEYTSDFIKYTGVDFKNCWRDYPNVLIWCGVVGLILYFI